MLKYLQSAPIIYLFSFSVQVVLYRFLCVIYVFECIADIGSQSVQHIQYPVYIYGPVSDALVPVPA